MPVKKHTPMKLSFNTIEEGAVIPFVSPWQSPYRIRSSQKHWTFFTEGFCR